MDKPFNEIKIKSDIRSKSFLFMAAKKFHEQQNYNLSNWALEEIKASFFQTRSVTGFTKPLKTKNAEAIKQYDQDNTKEHDRLKKMREQYSLEKITEENILETSSQDIFIFELQPKYKII